MLDKYGQAYGLVKPCVGLDGGGGGDDENVGLFINGG